MNFPQLSDATTAALASVMHQVCSELGILNENTGTEKDPVFTYDVLAAYICRLMSIYAVSPKAAYSVPMAAAMPNPKRGYQLPKEEPLVRAKTLCKQLGITGKVRLHHFTEHPLADAVTVLPSLKTLIGTFELSDFFKTGYGSLVEQLFGLLCDCEIADYSHNFRASELAKEKQLSLTSTSRSMIRSYESLVKEEEEGVSDLFALPVNLGKLLVGINANYAEPCAQALGGMTLGAAHTICHLLGHSERLTGESIQLICPGDSYVLKNGEGVSRCLSLTVVGNYLRLGCNVARSAHGAMGCLVAFPGQGPVGSTDFEC